MKSKKPINNIGLFPRSEYATRFTRTTAFKMTEHRYWNTYHRCSKTRFFREVGGRKNTQFSSPCTKKTSQKDVAFAAHTGGIASPFNTAKYSETIQLKTQSPIAKTNLRDASLVYKRKMAEIVIKSFKSKTKNKQKIKQRANSKSSTVRPIVFCENNYPCVLVQFPIFNSKDPRVKIAPYWAKHPKQFQQLLIASFVAFLNYEAYQQNIPIEMIIRASFGHNTPSVCETAKTFRINVGLIPRAYAQLIGETLHKLNQVIEEIIKQPPTEIIFDDAFHAKVRLYNATKLRNAIDGNKRNLYSKLKNSLDYKRAHMSDKHFKSLYQAFCQINTENPRGKSIFIPVNLKDKGLWEIIHSSGDSLGKSVLAECFRKNYTVDWFSTKILELLFEGDSHRDSITAALKLLLKQLRYNDKVTMNYDRIGRDLKDSKYLFESTSFENFYKTDPHFNHITNLLFTALGAKRPTKELYSGIEEAGAEFFSTTKGSKKINETADYGSDSDFSYDLSLDEFSDDSSSADASSDTEESSDEEFDTTIKQITPICHKKLRVCSGMKAIVIAYYSALSYLRDQGVKTFTLDKSHMYYEVETALQKVQDKKPAENKVRAKPGEAILLYDLNHCNADNSSTNPTLKEKLDAVTPSIAILDCTSSTYPEIKQALQQCFSQPNVDVVIFVDSGLKNNQSGLDFYPYGEARIFTRDKNTQETLMQLMLEGLSEEDKLNYKTHEMVRTCKRAGLAVSLRGFFKLKSSRFQLVSEDEFEIARPATSLTKKFCKS